MIDRLISEFSNVQGKQFQREDLIFLKHFFFNKDVRKYKNLLNKIQLQYANKNV